MDDHNMCILLEQEIQNWKEKYQMCRDAIVAIKEILDVQEDECVIERVEDLVDGTPDERVLRALIEEKDKEIERLWVLVSKK